MATVQSSSLATYLRKHATRRSISLELGSGFVNHLPHGIIALGKIGGTEEHFDRFREFNNQWSAQPKTLDYSQIESSEELLQYKGQGKNFLGVAEFLEREMKTKNWTSKQMVQSYLPSLFDGFTNRLIHPLITLGYAIDSDVDELIIDGLTFIFTAHQSAGAHPEIDLQELSANTNESSVAFTSQTVVELIHRIQEEKKLESIANDWERKVSDRNGKIGLFKRTTALCELGTETIDEYVLPLFQNPTIIDPFLKDLNNEGEDGYKKVFTELFDGIVWLYNDISELNGEGSFVLLHCITSCWSLGRILPFLTSEQRLAAIMYFLRTLIVEWCSMWDRTDFKLRESPHQRNYHGQYEKIPEISETIDHILNVASAGDAHATKIVYTCLDRLEGSHFCPISSEKYATLLKVIAARQYHLLPWK